MAMPRGNAASSQTTRATLGLRDLVFAGELAPEERVREVDLAERLGVSRTPLRLALTTLAHEGLLEALPGGGFVVRAFTADEITDGIELRGVLEGTAARLAAERVASEHEVAPLRAAIERIDEALAGPPEDMIVRYVAANEEFHARLIALAKSPPVERAIANVYALPFASPSALLASHAAILASREILVVAQYQHRRLVEAIRDGHGTRAEEIGREHARVARTNLDLALEDRDALRRIPGAPLLREVT
jgi:GntR family transcriptional regulator, vanillate catabolism transcriptional regulator